MDADAPTRASWNLSVLAASMFLGLLAQATVLPCLCRAGDVKMGVALAVDALVLLRTLVAMRIKEQGKGWVFYAALPVAIVPVLELTVHCWT